MIPAHSNMRSLHQRRTEVSQDHPLIGADHHQEAETTRTRRNSHASSGNKVDATEEQSVGSVMRANKSNPLVLPLLLGLRQTTRKDPSEETAEVQEKAGTALQSRRDQGVQRIAVPQRGIKASRKLPKLPSGRLPDCIYVSIGIQCMPVASNRRDQLPSSDFQHES